MKISIVTPAYNCATYIEETIQNINSQTYQNFEHIVIDGQSTDGTVEILKKHSHLRWISEPDKGQSNAINKGFKMANGEILAWQNADDLYFPDTFETVVDFFAKNPDVDLVYGGYQIIDSEGKKVCNVSSVDWNLWLFKHGRFVPVQPTVFWRKKVYKQIGELDENLNYCMDIDFFCRVAKSFKFARLKKMLGKFRIHEGSKTQNSNNFESVYQEQKQVLSKHYQYTILNDLMFDFFYYRSRLARKIKFRK